MCGINLIITTTNKPVKEALIAMQGATFHRGPDASQIFEHNNVDWHLTMGVNRLQVIDKDEASNQPMVSHCGNYVLAYNGEVYNYHDLKNQLITRGYEFATSSDTEVVLYWLQEFGADGLSAFKGMFALAFVDLRQQKLLIARDRHGIKPLFYCKTSNELIISSSIKGIEASGLMNLSINKGAIDDYLCYRHVMGNYTFYQEVWPHEPGVVSIYDDRLSTTSSVIKSQETEEDRTLKSILVESVSLQFEAASQPGLMLSGGVDSTVLLAILHKELAVDGVRTYTLGAGEDVKWARQASVQYGSSHQEVPVSIDTLEHIDDFLQHTDQPIADHGAFATWVVAQAAAKNSNVLFSGAGADELFGGYNRHRAYHYYMKNQKHAILAAKTAKMAVLGRWLPGNVKDLVDGVSTDPIITYMNFLQNHGIRKNSDVRKLWQASISMKDNLAKALAFDQSHYLVADVLAITDNATMQHGVEARIPFLYDDVVDYAKEISIAEKMKLKGKGPLKKLLIEYEGKKYTRRRKHGFGLPIAAWLADKKSYWLWEFMVHDSPVFEFIPKSEIYQLLRLHNRGKVDNSMQLWSILVLEKWLANFYK
jgi:asparagine synthase (glutamine-hydrolysing)